MTPSRRLQAKGEMSTLQTGKDTIMMRKRFISNPDLMIKILPGNQGKSTDILQISAGVLTGVCAYMDATPLVWI